MNPHTLPPDTPPDEAALLRAMRINSAIALASLVPTFGGIALIVASLFVPLVSPRYEYYPVTTYHVDVKATPESAVVLSPDDPDAKSAAQGLIDGSGGYLLSVVIELERPVPSRGSKNFHPSYRQPSDDEIARALPNSAVSLRFHAMKYSKGELLSFLHPFDGKPNGLTKSAALPAEIVSRSLAPLADHVLTASGDPAFANCVRAGGCPRTPLPGVSSAVVSMLPFAGLALIALGVVTLSISRVRAARTHRDFMAHLS